MQQPIRIEPRRWHSKGEATRNHTEVYLPEQVVAFFVDDEVALISHISSGDGQEWREIVTIDPGEFNNENGTEPLVRREIGKSVTPGGVFRFDRMVEGLRNSALGGMWDPAYFNYGIAIHGALNVPLHPASHGCIRMPQTIGRIFHEYIDVGDQVFVWDGIKEPEVYAANAEAPYPAGPGAAVQHGGSHVHDDDHDDNATANDGVAPRFQPPVTPAPTQPPTAAPTPAPTQPPTTAPPPPVTTATTTTTTSTTVPAVGG